MSRVVTVPLPTVSIEALQRHFNEAEGKPDALWLSPSQFTDYGNLLTRLVRYVPDGKSETAPVGKDDALAFNGVPVVERPRWATGTLGLVYDEEG